MEQLVDDLLHLARSDRDRVTRTEPVDLDDVVFREVERLRGRGRRVIDVHDVSGAQLLGDRDHLARAVRNLLENASRYARERITLSLSENPNAVTLTVTDDGPGIPAEARERIFERVTRLDEARATRAGRGGAGRGWDWGSRSRATSPSGTGARSSLIQHTARARGSSCGCRPPART